MVMKKLLSMSLILSVCSSNLFAQTTPEVCALGDSVAIKKVRIPDLPGFFFKVHPDGKHIAFISSETNKLLDLETGKTTKLPGMVDPVWSPDGKFLTVPFVNLPNETQSLFGFYETNSIIETSKQEGDLNTLGSGAKIEGVYQSLGKQGDSYRMVTDEMGLVLGDVTFNDNKVAIKSAFTRPCSNLDRLPTDLPMLSKDGKYLSVYDSESKSTKIFHVAEDKSCNLAVDLGIGTGKVSFNNDSSQIAFHVDQFSDFEEGYFSGISKDKLKNVIVVNLEASEEGKKLKATSWAQASHHVKAGDGAYYPDFDGKDNVYYLEDVNNHYQFVQTNSSLLDFHSTTPSGLIDVISCSNCHQKETKSNVSVMAKMWSDICKGQTKMDLTLAPSLIGAMDPKACLEMVDQFWVASLGVTKDELKAACPKKKGPTGEIIGNWGEEQAQSAKALIQSRCLMCHRRDMEYETEETITVATGPETQIKETRKVKKFLPALKAEGNDPVISARMMHSIETYGNPEAAMPKGSSLEPDQVKLLRDYFRRDLLDVPREAMGELYSPGMYISRYSDEHLEAEKKKILEYTPNATEEMIKEISMWSDCIYGQKNCQEYIDYKIPQYRSEAEKLPLEKREEFIQDQVLSFKCLNYFEITKDQCIEAKLKKSLSTK